MEESDLEQSLKEYEVQLSSLRAAAVVADSDTKAELQKFICDLEQLQKETKDSLLTIKKNRLLAQLNELATKNDETAVVNEPAVTVPVIEKNVNESFLQNELAALEGSRCRAPFSQEWGEHSYHNAIVLSVEPSDTISSIQDIQVRVLFCNPLNNGMKPCPFFMEGSCKFPDSCRYSHGHLVKFEDLQEFHDPDYSLLQEGSKCLAKFHDNLWYKATLEEILADQKICVKYDQYGTTDTLSLEDIVPLTSMDESSSSDSEDDCNERWLEEETIVPFQLPVATADALGAWEKHTRGIGSKLMAKMGYIIGQGLGRNGEGRTQPVEAILFPPGKSLDKCLQLRENRENNPLKKIRQLKKEKRKEEKIKARYDKSKQDNIFDFLNKRISYEKGSPSTSKQVPNSDNFKTSSTKNLNVQAIKIGDDIKKVGKELQHLQKSLLRNSSDKIVSEQIKSRISVVENQLQGLQQKEKSVIREQNSRQAHQKLTVF